jgi:AcrR family transcriptional regulator
MDTREKILNTARDEFVEHGLDGARVDRIAGRAGVNKAMLYYHFGSKENLYQTVIDSHFEMIGDFVSKAMLEDPNPEEFILKISTFYNTAMFERSTLFPIILRELAQGGERIRVPLERIMGASGRISKLRKSIDEGIELGKLRNMDCRQAIISFMGMNLFYLILSPILNPIWEIKDEKEFREKRPKEIVDLFLYGIKAR